MCLVPVLREVSAGGLEWRIRRRPPVEMDLEMGFRIPPDSLSVVQDSLKGLDSVWRPWTDFRSRLVWARDSHVFEVWEMAPLPAIVEALDSEWLSTLACWSESAS